LTRQIGDCQVVLAVQGSYQFGDNDLMEVIEQIVDHQVNFFGGAPRSRYLFLVNPHPDQGDPRALHYFGLHFDSSMIVLLDPRTDRVRLQREPASLCAHEFFHNWLGEQLAQDDYGMNWFVEGVTTWYAYRTRLATRMLDMGSYAEQLASRYQSQYLDHGLRESMSVADAGGRVLQDPNVTSLLYSGGLFVAVALDAEIDAVTSHEAGLDQIVQNMVRRARLDPDYRLSRETLEAELKEVTGQNFRPWLERHVYGVESLPLPAYVTTARSSG
jgi:predicted metalloprotease with PDZ domain